MGGFSYPVGRAWRWPNDLRCRRLRRHLFFCAHNAADYGDLPSAS
jgi:hypothetical protein